MSKVFAIEEKKVFFMRHGRALKNTDYETMNYSEFMRFMQKKEDPELCLERHEIKAMPCQIEVIYHSGAQRSIKTAMFIQQCLADPPKIDGTLKELTREVDFSDSIIDEHEFQERGGLRGCRELILKRWHANQNNAESFEKSVERLKSLQCRINEVEFNNILVITHGWYLRLVHLFYARKPLTLENLLTAPNLKYGEILNESLLYPERFCRDTTDFENGTHNGHLEFMKYESKALSGSLV